MDIEENRLLQSASSTSIQRGEEIWYLFRWLFKSCDIQSDFFLGNNSRGEPFK